MHGNGQVRGTEQQINVKNVSLVKKTGGEEDFQVSKTQANTNTLKKQMLLLLPLCTSPTL